MNRTIMTGSLALSLLLAVPFSAHAQHGIVEYEMPYSETDYVECLGEDVAFDVTVTVRAHALELPTGGSHFVENWFLEGIATGLSSGLTWYANAVSPFGGNAGGDRFEWGWNVEGMYEPLDGGRKFRKSQRIRVVYDANGLPRVEHYEPYDLRCLGKGKN